LCPWTDAQSGAQPQYSMVHSRCGTGRAAIRAGTGGRVRVERASV